MTYIPRQYTYYQVYRNNRPHDDHLNFHKTLSRANTYLKGLFANGDLLSIKKITIKNIPLKEAIK